MALKFTVDSLEGIDEAAKGFYKEQDGGSFVLEVEGAVAQSKFDEVNQRAVDAQTEAQRRRKTVERVTGKLGLENADGLDQALDDLLSKKATPPKDDAAQKAIVDQIRAEAENKVNALQSRLDGVLLGAARAEFKSELQSAGFSGKVAEMLAGANMNKVQFDNDGKMAIMQDNGNPLAGSGADGRATLADLAKNFAADYSDLLTDTGKGGSGKPPASGGGKAAPKQITRQAFDALDAGSKAEHIRQGGVVTD